MLDKICLTQTCVLLTLTGEHGQKLDVPSSKTHSVNAILMSLTIPTINDVCTMHVDVIPVAIAIASVLLLLHMPMNVTERVFMFTGDHKICAQCNVMAIEYTIPASLRAQSHATTIIWLLRYMVKIM